MESHRRSTRRPAHTKGTLIAGQTATVSRPSRPRRSIHADTCRRDMPALPVRDTVILPGMVVPLYVDESSALQSIDAAMADDRTILVVTRRTSEQKVPLNPLAPDVFSIGTECSIGRVLRMPDGTNNVLIQGLRRARIDEWLAPGVNSWVSVSCYDEPDPRGTNLEALKRAVLSLLERCTKLSTRLTEDAYIQALNIDRAGALADYVVATLEPPIMARQEILEILDVPERLRRTCHLLSGELHVLELEQKIQSEVQQEVDRGQREYYLREQLKVIQRELGEHDPAWREGSQLRDKLAARQLPELVSPHIFRELERLESMT